MKNKTNGGIVDGLFWTFLERISAQLVSTIVGIILARALMPEEYGIISIVMIFIDFCNVFVTSGFGTAVIQKQNADKKDFNTAFVMSFGVSVLLYIVLFVSAPYIASFYEMSILENVLRVLGIRLLFTSINNVQQSFIQRDLQFRKLFFATIAGTVLSCVAGVAMAYSGFGVWALVTQYLLNVIIGTIALSFVCGWHPGLELSKESAKLIFSFGGKVLATNIVFTINAKFRSFATGKFFGAEALAFYDQGQKYPTLLVSNINASIQKVLLPVYSRKQDDIVDLKNTLRKSIQIGMFILAPMMIGLCAISNSFVSAVLTEKWVEAVPYMQIFSIMYITRPFESSCHQALLALGKASLVFWIMVIIDGLGLVLAIIAIFVMKNVLWLAIFSLVTTGVSIVCFLCAANKLFHYHLVELMTDTIPTILIATIMGITVSFMGFLPAPMIAKLVLQIVCGVAVYIVLAYVTKSQAFYYLLSRIKNTFKKEEK